MHTLVPLMLAGALGLTTALGGQQAATPDFRPLEFLVGHCWVGTFPDGKRTDEHCFEWMYDRKFIRDRHIVRGGKAYQGESIYAWDPVINQLSYTYWSSDGLLMVGRVEYTADGIVFPSRYGTPSGDVELRAAWTRAGDDAYRVRQSQRAPGGWKELWTMELKRKN